MPVPDSMNAVKCINKEEALPWYCLNLVMSIQGLCAQFDVISFAHVYRETNGVVDHLASLGRSFDNNIVYFVALLDMEMDIIVKEEASGRIIGCVTILRKGKSDLVSDGKTVNTVSTFGSPRRCGGQGDILSGRSDNTGVEII
ncbi:hypothetical protein IFM89_017173 [Coptis chinensis]|uniref:RNase H type-1 domain-containing protein n=1 Tax=Coptis chinensis TaxID=261450 RepID=A0A835HVE1_9MAGN|nr:hypothetical protein IFM89_017173 [Coptis chinensis]